MTAPCLERLRLAHRRPRFAFPRTLLGGIIEVDSARAWIRAVLLAGLLLGPARLTLALAARLPRRLGRHRIVRGTERLTARLVAGLLAAHLDIDGLQHIDRHERYVVVALHEGFADALALLRLPIPLTAVARDELTTLPLVGGQLHRGDHILIEPERPVAAARTLRRLAPAAVARGDSLLLFPQGSILGIELAFQPGAFYLAQRLRRPILPVVITGSHRVWEHPFTPALRIGQPISMRVLPPVAPADAVRTRRQIERAMKRFAREGAAIGSLAPHRHFDPRTDGFWDGYRYDVDPAYPALARTVAAHRARSGGNRAGETAAAG